MRTTLQAAILAMAAAVAACDRPQNTAYNNSGRTAEVAGTSAPAPTATPGDAASTTAPATSDTASPGIAAAGTTADAQASGSAADEQTSTKILAAITADSGMKDADVNVTTSNGVVTLGGKARSPDQVALATGIAQRQEGVARVESRIAVN